METKTVAEIISAKFGDNGSCFVADDGRQLVECLDQECTWKVTAGGDEVRFEFSDHSVIVVAGGAWDLGFPETRCHCWTSCGHHAECEAAAPEPRVAELRERIEELRSAEGRKPLPQQSTYLLLDTLEEEIGETETGEDLDILHHRLDQLSTAQSPRAT